MTFVARIVSLCKDGNLTCRRQVFQPMDRSFLDLEDSEPVDVVPLKQFARVEIGRLVIVHAMGGHPGCLPLYVCEV